MPHYGPDCDGCGGEDCCCCPAYLESVADARNNLYNEPYDYEYADLYGEAHDRDFDDLDDLDEESDQDYYSRNDGDYQDEYEYELIDTPFGDQYGNGFDEE